MLKRIILSTSHVYCFVLKSDRANNVGENCLRYSSAMADQRYFHDFDFVTGRLVLS